MSNTRLTGFFPAACNAGWEVWVTCSVRCRLLDPQDFSMQCAMQVGGFMLPVECSVERSTYRFFPCGVQCRVGSNYVNHLDFLKLKSTCMFNLISFSSLLLQHYSFC